MNNRSLARIVAIAFGVAPAMWAPTAHAQTVLAPDLVVSRVGLTCEGMVLTVTNTGRTAVSASAPSIILRGTMVINVDSPQNIDMPISVAGLQPTQTKTVTLPLQNATGALGIMAVVDATNRLPERDETNNVREIIDERAPCPIVIVSDARVVEGGDLVFTASIDRRPLKDATFSWSTGSGTTAVGGAACGGAIDFVNGSGTLTFPASGFIALTPKTIRIATCSDATAEPSEMMRLSFSGLRNMTMNSTSRTGTIDNKAP